MVGPASAGGARPGRSRPRRLALGGLDAGRGLGHARQPRRAARRGGGLEPRRRLKAEAPGQGKQDRGERPGEPGGVERVRGPVAGNCGAVPEGRGELPPTGGRRARRRSRRPAQQGSSPGRNAPAESGIQTPRVRVAEVELAQGRARSPDVIRGGHGGRRLAGGVLVTASPVPGRRPAGPARGASDAPASGTGRGDRGGSPREGRMRGARPSRPGAGAGASAAPAPRADRGPGAGGRPTLDVRRHEGVLEGRPRRLVRGRLAGGRPDGQAANRISNAGSVGGAVARSRARRAGADGVRVSVSCRAGGHRRTGRSRRRRAGGRRAGRPGGRATSSPMMAGLGSGADRRARPAHEAEQAENGFSASGTAGGS